MIKIELFEPVWLSEIGKRPNNEDSVSPKKPTSEGKFFVVCDGVGGSEKGEVASSLTCSVIDEYFNKNPNVKIDESFFDSVINEIKERFVQAIKQDPYCKNMASTLTLLTFHAGGYTVAWAGDSRVYHIRNGKILFKTHDHKNNRNQVSKYINESVRSSDIEMFCSNNISDDDFFILCTDGVLEGFTDEDLCNLCSYDKQPQQVRDTIIDRCSQVSNDNHTAYIIKIKKVQRGDLVPVIKKDKNNYCRSFWFLTIFFIIASLVLCGLYIERINHTPINNDEPSYEMKTTNGLIIIDKNYSEAFKKYKDLNIDLNDITKNPQKYAGNYKAIVFFLLNEINNTTDSLNKCNQLLNNTPIASVEDNKDNRVKKTALVNDKNNSGNNGSTGLTGNTGSKDAAGSTGVTGNNGTSVPKASDSSGNKSIPQLKDTNKIK